MKTFKKVLYIILCKYFLNTPHLIRKCPPKVLTLSTHLQNRLEKILPSLQRSRKNYILQIKLERMASKVRS